MRQTKNPAPKKVSAWVKNGTLQITKKDLDVYTNLMADVKAVDIPKERLNDVLPTHDNAPGYAGSFNDILPNLDPVLEEDPGSGYNLHESILNNAFVYGCYDSRINNVLSQEFYLAQSDCGDAEFETANELVEEMQKYGLIKNVLRGRFISPSTTAIPWDQDKYRLPVSSMIYKVPADRVRFNKENQLVILTDEHPDDGEIVHPHNYIVAAEDADFLNPYGTSILSKIYWMVFILKKVYGYWTTLAEDHTIPFLDASFDVEKIQKYQSGKKVDMQKTAEEVLQYLALMRKNRILSHGNFLDVALKESGTKSAADVFDKLILSCKKSISVLLTGHESTSMSVAGELGGKDKILTIRDEIKNADVRFVTRYVNMLIDRVWFWNFPGKPKPYFTTKQEADIDKLIKKAEFFSIVETNLGRKIKDEYLADELEIPFEALGERIEKQEAKPKEEESGENDNEDDEAEDEESEDEKDEDKSNLKNVPASLKDFAFTNEDKKEEYEELMDDFKEWLNAPKTNDDMMKELTKPLFKFADKSKSLEEMKDNYYKLYKKLDEEDFEERIYHAGFLSYLVGYVYSEAKEAGLADIEEDENKRNLILERFINKEEPEITVKMLKLAMKMPPKEAVEYFKSKGIEISFDWQEAAEKIEKHAFTVSGVLKMDILKDFKDLVTDAIEQGKSRAQFRKDLDELLAKRGWVGKKDAKPGTKEKLQSPWRMNLIYHNNTRDALHNAKWDQMQSTEDVIPYVKSVARMNGLHPDSTEQCKALHNKIFSKSDKYYQKYLRCLRHHNCYSIEVSLTEEMLGSKKVRKGTEFKQYKNPKGFTHDGPWKPDLSKYPKELVDEYEG